MYLGYEDKRRGIILIFSFVVSILLIIGGFFLDLYCPIASFNFRVLTLVGIGCLVLSFGLFSLFIVPNIDVRSSWRYRQFIQGIALIVGGLVIIWISLNQ